MQYRQPIHVIQLLDSKNSSGKIAAIAKVKGKYVNTIRKGQSFIFCVLCQEFVNYGNSNSQSCKNLHDVNFLDDFIRLYNIDLYMFNRFVTQRYMRMPSCGET